MTDLRHELEALTSGENATPAGMVSKYADVIADYLGHDVPSKVIYRAILKIEGCTFSYQGFLNAVDRARKQGRLKAPKHRKRPSGDPISTTTYQNGSQKPLDAPSDTETPSSGGQTPLGPESDRKSQETPSSSQEDDLSVWGPPKPEMTSDVVNDLFRKQPKP